MSLHRRFASSAVGLSLLFLAHGAGLSPSAWAGGVRIVEPTGLLNFPDIASAVAAASEGDVLLVGAGDYPGFSINGKSVSIFAAPTGAVVNVTWSAAISNLTDVQTVVISGIRIAPGVAFHSNPVLSISDCAGHVRVERSTFQSPNFTPGFCFGTPLYDGAPGARVTASTRVAFQGCTFVGGKGEGLDPFEDNCFPAGDGGSGIVLNGSSVALYDCTATGGEGGGSENIKGVGGHGASISGGSFLASASTFKGGRGGQNFNLIVGACGAAGGNGLDLSETAGYAIGCTFLPGPGGFGTGCLGPPGVPVSGVTLTTLPVLARVATVSPAVLGDRSSWTVGFQGAPNDRAYWLESVPPAFQIAPAFNGAWLVMRSALLPVQFLGAAPGSGHISAFPATGDLPAGSLYERRYAQVGVRALGAVHLGSHAAVLVLDRDSGPDCNGNGTCDYVDVIENPGMDANHNLIPDTCLGG